jgi:hypothetical protein
VRDRAVSGPRRHSRTTRVDGRAGRRHNVARPANERVKKKSTPDGVAVIREVLDASRPRPDVAAPVGEKNQYAVRFAEHMAKRVADDLAPRLRGIHATTKRTAGSVRGQKQLDVNFSTPQHGLALGISLKSVHLRDAKSGRYTHNMKRNEEELRIEASGYHKRQPYAVMVGVLVLPFDSCDDAKRDNPSSFGSWVRHLRPYCGRVQPDDEIDRFEKLYVALYEADGSDVRFFDIESDPPKSRRPTRDGDLVTADGRPRRLLTYGEFVDAVYHRYLQRNSAEFRWADGEEAPLEVDEAEEEEQDDET